MHILLIHQAFTTMKEPGGTRHYELSRYLADRGHRVTVLAGQVSYLTGERGRKGWVIKEETENGLEIRRCFSLPGWHRSFVSRTLSFISFSVSSFLVGLGVKDVDLVWGTSPPILQAATALGLAKLKRAKFVFEVRDLWPKFAIAVGVLRNPVLIRASEWLERVLCEKADRVVVNSPGFIEHVRGRGARNIDLVPNAVDTGMFDPKATGVTYRQGHGLEGKFVVMYAGAHGMSNDLRVVLQAAQQLERYDGVVFVLVGDGKEKPALQDEAERLGLKNLKFMPPVSKSEMPDVLAAADACIAILKPLDVYRTTYPNKVFDYMAASKPVVLAIDGAIREVVEGAGAGLFCPPGGPVALAQAVLVLVFDRRRGEAMGKAGRAYVEAHFDRATIVNKMEQAMLAALGEASAAEASEPVDSAGEAS
jgi:glycosyltransferase involved in cell wall biosynthesis